MPYCAGVNLTETDVYYHQKIYGQKSWAWWLNHLGRMTRPTNDLALYDVLP